jgi:hypothetical protein
LHDNCDDRFKADCEDHDRTIVDNGGCQAAYDDIDWTELNLNDLAIEAIVSQ